MIECAKFLRCPCQLLLCLGERKTCCCNQRPWPLAFSFLRRLTNSPPAHPARPPIFTGTTMATCATLLDEASRHRTILGAHLNHAVLAAQFEAAAQALRHFFNPAVGRALYMIGVKSRVDRLLDEVSTWAQEHLAAEVVGSGGSGPDSTATARLGQTTSRTGGGGGDGAGDRGGAEVLAPAAANSFTLSNTRDWLN